METEQPPAPRRIAGFHVFLLVAVGIAVLLLISRTVKGTDRPTDIGAFAACRSFVEQQLKAPASATFAPMAASQTDDRGGGAYRVTSFVDADNSFGANVRTRYTCRVRMVNGRWQLDDLTTS